MTEEKEIQAKRAIWHSRRGMLELDVLLLPFAQQLILIIQLRILLLSKR